MTDEVLERFITTLKAIGVEYGSTEPGISRTAFDLMGELIKHRTPEQIERMETKLPRRWGT